MSTVRESKTHVDPAADFTAGPSRVPVVAMVGAGQLARMAHQAAISLGVTLRVLAASSDDPAVRAGAATVLGSPDSLEDLRRLAEGADVVTFDHEQIPPEYLSALEQDGVRLAPPAAAKLFAQDKLHARRSLGDLGFPVPEFELVRTIDELVAFGGRHGWPVVAKPPRGGYDGRGVHWLADPAEAAEVLDAYPDGILLEPQLELVCELAVLVARNASGECVTYPVVESVQSDGMCRELKVPAPVDPELAAEAEVMAAEIAERIGAVGVMAVELFVTDTGLYVNELALRLHNTGHYTIEGTVTSQFEQHLRAVLGWPLGAVTLTAPAVATVNVVGSDTAHDPIAGLAGALSVPEAHVHLYGKQSRPGRKLGHVTVCGEDIELALATARKAVAHLEGRA